MTTSEQFQLAEVTPAYWRVTFSNGPVNLIDTDTIDQLAALVDHIEAAPELTVVVFRSDNPDYFMAHWDFLANPNVVAAMPPGPTGLHPYLDNLVRLSKVPAATISAVRGRARAAGSEFVLATDIRSPPTGRYSGNSRWASARSPAAGPWRGWPAWSAAAARWRSCSGATTSPRTSPRSTATSTGLCPTASSTSS